MKLSEYFDSREFACHDGSEHAISAELISKLTALRKEIGKPITITSGYRSPAYNKSIKGATNSFHMRGMAADCQVEGMTPAQLKAIALRIGFRGIGLYDNFIHLDVRAKYTEWDFRTKKDAEGNDIMKKGIGIIIDGKDMGRIGVLIDGLTYIPVRTTKEELGIKEAVWVENTETAIIKTEVGANGGH